jgi:hypothetical protein
MVRFYSKHFTPKPPFLVNSSSFKMCYKYATGALKSLLTHGSGEFS